MRLLVIALLALCAAAPRAHAQGSDATPAAREQARQAFARAIALSDEQRLPEALVELERAYELSPHFAVLYNLGKTYAALERPIEAIAALERYLREGGERVEPARRAQVEALLAAERARVATLVIDVEPAGAAIAVDARAIGSAPLSEGITLVAGEHVVRVEHPGHARFERSIVFPAGQRTALQVQLAPEDKSAAPRGLLALRCELPDVRIELGDRTLGTTPLRAPLALPEGTHTLSLSRSGYRTQQLSVRVRSDGLEHASCAPSPLSPLPADAGKLAIAVSEPDAAIAIDGVHASEIARLPPGRHRIEVSRPGFARYVEDITLGARSDLRVRAELRPEPAYRRDYEARAGAQRTWAFVLGGAGLALTGAAVSVLIWNETRYADWREEDRALAAALEARSGEPDALQRRQERNNDALTSIQRWEVVAAGAGVAGVLLGAAGAVLFFSGDDPERYRALDVAIAPDSVALRYKAKL